jgi:hypothetical protein
MAAPDISNCGEEMLALWPAEQPAQGPVTVSTDLMMEDLLEVYDARLPAVVQSGAYMIHRPLVSDPPSHRKTVRLLRHIGSYDKSYRLVINTVYTTGQRSPPRLSLSPFSSFYVVCKS